MPKERLDMPGITRTPRSRGLISGLLVFLAGGWGGLAPFVGPYLGYGLRPDRAWELTTGRLYLSAVPGALALLAGLVIILTRSRALGVFCSLLGVLAGAWFLGGAGVLGLVGWPRPALGAAIPLQSGSAAATLTEFGLFTGVGLLLVAFGGVAAGRFSISALRDFVITAEDYAEPGVTIPGFQPAGDPFAITSEITRSEAP